MGMDFYIDNENLQDDDMRFRALIPLIEAETDYGFLRDETEYGLCLAPHHDFEPGDCKEIAEALIEVSNRDPMGSLTLHNGVVLPVVWTDYEHTHITRDEARHAALWFAIAASHGGAYLA